MHTMPLDMPRKLPKHAMCIDECLRTDKKAVCLDRDPAPRFTGEEFGPAVLDLLSQRDRSIRWLAQQIGTSHTQVRFYLTGKRPILNLHDARGSMIRIEAVARALRVHPSYFAEWRRLWIMTLLDSAFAARPGLSVGVFKRFAGFEDQRGATKPASSSSTRPGVNVRSHQGAM